MKLQEPKISIWFLCKPKQVLRLPNAIFVTHRELSKAQIPKAKYELKQNKAPEAEIILLFSNCHADICEGQLHSNQTEYQ